MNRDRSLVLNTMTTQDGAPKSVHRSTERVISIFEYLTETENVGKNLTEIAQYLESPKSSILPMLRTLVARGYLHYNGLTHQYFIGYKLYEIGTKYVGNTNIDDAIYLLLKNLVTSNGVAVLLGELVAGDVLFLQKVGLFEEFRLYRAVGRRTPAYASALGKVLLSDKSKEDIRRLYPDGLTPITNKTITDFDVLDAELAQTRQIGFARCNEECTQYVASIAVPIRKGGRIVYGIEVNMSIFEYNDEKEHELLYALYDTKNKIENFLKSQ